MENSRVPTVSAHSAVVPVTGYGTMLLPERPAELVAAAIAAGYRAIDTARVDFTLSDEEMGRLSALRKRQIRIADPPERAPKWDVETVV